jgi:hypothetical protein
MATPAATTTSIHSGGLPKSIGHGADGRPPGDHCGGLRRGSGGVERRHHERDDPKRLPDLPQDRRDAGRVVSQPSYRDLPA